MTMAPIELEPLEVQAAHEWRGGPSKLADALAKAQGEIKNPAKTAENPHFKSSYANLATGIDSIRAALSKHGIAFTQPTRAQGELLMLYTRLIHSSGEWLESEWPVGSFTKLTPQQMGSALTYARRYSLFSLVGISGGDDDDDGHAASNGGARHAPPPPPPPKKPAPFDWTEARKFLAGADTETDLNIRYEKIVKAYPHAKGDELDAIIREVGAKFWTEDA